MSKDHLLLALDQNAKALDPLRGHTPLFAAIASVEDSGTTDPFAALPRALHDYLHRTTGPVALTQPVPVSTSVSGPTYGLAVYAEASADEAGRGAADRAFRPLAHRLAGVVRELPDALLRRLGVRDSSAPLHDWLWVLFQLAWHFPDHFARGVAHRQRLLTAGDRGFVAPELCLQLDGVVNDARDIYPGVIFSRFPPALDLVTATGYAVELLGRAIRGGGEFRVTDAVRDELRRMHREFVAAGRLYADLPAMPWAEAEFRVLRLANSFRTPPAAQWAGYRPAGPGQETLLLSHGRQSREVCVVGGPWVADFTRRADRAGALLPAWPDAPSAALLEDADIWLMRVARRRELQSEQFYLCTEDGSPPHGQPIPRSQMIEHHWASTRPGAGWAGLVTDHRGNVERWVGFVCYVLKEYDPDAVEIRHVPDGGRRAHLHPNAVLTFPGLNPFQASARAMELAEWVWPEPVGSGTGSTRPPAAADGPAGRLRFEDAPPPANDYPRPGAGRYVRFHRGDRSAEGEPEWRWAWAWAERPEDGWVECGLAGPGVLIGTGRPPAACGWLPAEWPADLFPLGGGPAHYGGWRSLVRSVLDGGSDTIPPDHSRYGWLTLTRATRLLAHHQGLLPTERLLAPLPASRDDARREAHPLLDGLVLAGRPQAEPAPADAPVQDALRPSAPTAPPSLAPASGRWLGEALALLDEAAAGLSDFGDRTPPFTAPASAWGAWRSRVAGVTLIEAETTLQGMIDRSAGAPHRGLPGELRALWLEVKCWGPGRARTWDEFEGSRHSTDHSRLARALVSWRERFQRLFLYLGIELPTPGPGSEPDPAPRRDAPGVTAQGERGRRLRCDEADRSVYLDGRRITGEMDLTLFRFFRVLVELYPNAIPFRLMKGRVPGGSGKHATRDFRDRLPPELSRLVNSGRAGYYLRLPPPK